MSKSSAEFAEKLRRRREAADGGASFESAPVESVADAQQTSPTHKASPSGDTSPGRAQRKATIQDFESAMNRQRGKTAEGQLFESKPEATRADVSAASRQGGKPAKGEMFESKPEASRADASHHGDASGRVPKQKAQAKTRQSKPVAAGVSAASVGQETVEEVRPPSPPPAETPASAAPPSPAELEATPAVDSGLVAAGPVTVTEMDSPVGKNAAKQADADSESSGEDTDDNMPQLEGAKGEAKQNRAEKKSRKAVLKLGMKPVPSIMRVTMRKAPKVLFAIERPEVFKAPNSDTYVVFGQAKIEDLSAQAQASAAERVTSSLPESTVDAPRATELEEEEEDNEEVDESGIESKDIELVVSQAGVSRARAVKALKANNNDIVEAIMALSST